MFLRNKDDSLKKNVTLENVRLRIKNVNDDELKKLYQDRMADKKSIGRRRKGKDIERLDNLLQHFFRKDKQALKKMKENQALQAWPQYVGEVAARVSRALRVQNKTLVVYVADSMWMHELSWLKQVLLQKYQREFPDLRLNDIFFTTKKTPPNRTNPEGEK